MPPAPRDQNHIPTGLMESSTTPGVVLPLKGSQATGRLLVSGVSGAGTVTSVSVASANGFSGTVTTPTSTPAITIQTTITGLLLGNGVSVSAAATVGTGSVVLQTSPTLITPLLGTPTSGVLTNCTGYPASSLVGTVGVAQGGTNVTSYVKGDILVATSTTTLVRFPVGTNTHVISADSAEATGLRWVAPSPINTITVASTTVGSGISGRILFNNAGTLGEYVISGTGNVAMTTSPTFVTPVLGTPASGVLTSCTGYPASALVGLGTGVATALAINVGLAGAFVTFNGALGTPASGVVTNLTGTASININGTVGATTPSTGAFTTLSASSAITASTTIELGHATDTTLSRSAAGVLAVEGVVIPTISSTSTLTNKTITSYIDTGKRIVTLTDAATIATDAALGNILRVTLTANRTLGVPTNPTDGQMVEYQFKQDATGSRTITFTLTAGGFRGSTDTPLPTLTTTANATDRVLFEYRLTPNFWEVVAVNKGYAS